MNPHFYPFFFIFLGDNIAKNKVQRKPVYFGSEERMEYMSGIHTDYFIINDRYLNINRATNVLI